MGDDPEIQMKMAELTGHLNGYLAFHNLDQQFALHLDPNADLTKVADAIIVELRKQRSSSYCLSVGRSSKNEIAIVVKFRPNN
jgi:hypothetical protein